MHWWWNNTIGGNGTIVWHLTIFSEPPITTDTCWKHAVGVFKISFLFCPCMGKLVGKSTNKCHSRLAYGEGQVLKKSSLNQLAKGDFSRAFHQSDATSVVLDKTTTGGVICLAAKSLLAGNYDVKTAPKLGNDNGGKWKNKMDTFGARQLMWCYGNWARQLMWRYGNRPNSLTKFSWF